MHSLQRLGIHQSKEDDTRLGNSMSPASSLLYGTFPLLAPRGSPHS